MTCTTCGRENPPHLTFCQECGQRLGPRVAPPTPPIGIGVEEPPPAPPPRVRSPLHDTTIDPPARPNFAEAVRCPVCDTANTGGLRYCTSCGSSLVNAQTAQPPAYGAPPSRAVVPQRVDPPIEPPRIAASPIAPIAPARVVDLGGAAAGPAPESRNCPRCRGAVDAGAQFCKFCGASLDGSGQRVSARPANGSPSASRQPTAARGRLVVIAKSGADGPNYPIGDSLDIGRTEGQLIIGEDPYLSPRHVRVLFQAGKLVLRDLGSTNGVFLRLSQVRDMNSPRRARAGNDEVPPSEVAVPLEDQDLILVGQQVLRFEIVKEGETGLGPAVEHGTVLFGSPAAPRYARLGQRTVEGVTRDVYYLRKVETVLGRESGDVVFTEDAFLSRRHAAIRLLGRDGSPFPAGSKPPPGSGLGYALVDLGSSNGTFLRIRSETELAPGDHFRVGQQLFRVDFDSLQAG